MFTCSSVQKHIILVAPEKKSVCMIRPLKTVQNFETVDEVYPLSSMNVSTQSGLTGIVVSRITLSQNFVG